MKPLTTLVRVKHGSHLYGTNTPASDQDFKGVHLPSGEAIILQRAENVIDTSVVSKDQSGKNNDLAIDSQSYSMQKFFELLAVGDMTATEILFAEPTEAHELWPTVQHVGKQLINRQVKGFVGYCRRQAAKYGVKGSRMSAVKALLDLLRYSVTEYKGQAEPYTLATIEPALRSFADHTLHCEFENIPSPNGADLWHIVCCDRKMPMTAKITEAINVYGKVWDNYGERARQAMDNKGIDWKAISHAVRVARQALELLETGKLTFPRPDADELRRIKLGEVPYKEVEPMLEALVEQVENFKGSILPKKTDHKMLDRCVREFYYFQVAESAAARAAREEPMP